MQEKLCLTYLKEKFSEIYCMTKEIFERLQELAVENNIEKIVFNEEGKIRLTDNGLNLLYDTRDLGVIAIEEKGLGKYFVSETPIQWENIGRHGVIPVNEIFMLQDKTRERQEQKDHNFYEHLLSR